MPVQGTGGQNVKEGRWYLPFLSDFWSESVGQATSLDQPTVFCSAIYLFQEGGWIPELLYALK